MSFRWMICDSAVIVALQLPAAGGLLGEVQLGVAFVLHQGLLLQAIYGIPSNDNWDEKTFE